MKRASILFFLLSFSINKISFAQGDKTFYGGLFFISNYIASDEFTLLKKTTPDLQEVDIIYSKALKYFDNDISEALLCLTFSTLPFSKIDFKTPFGILKIPLPSPPKNIFDKRLENLPKQLFFNSPNTNFGDKDKLAHFFGNAFLRYNISVFNLSKFMGIFVETTEQNFFANGGFDLRDLVVNNLGEIFALMLKQNRDAQPSNALIIYQFIFMRPQ